ncbi:hypothetical protein B0H12DRAFT_1137992 [Mycena haematopus]|nr:hypothetical protein B0H12DRAFT_1137992 [Mycena haematopus]
MISLLYIFIFCGLCAETISLFCTFKSSTMAPVLLSAICFLIMATTRCLLWIPV